MRFEGFTTFTASRAAVWTFLADPTRLSVCLPMRLPIQAVGDGRYRIEGRVGSGLFATSLTADLDVTTPEPDRVLALAAHGGASGTTFHGAVRYTFRPGPPEGPTTVDWAVDLELQGGFASMISRGLEQRGEEALDQLSACLRARIEAPG